MADVRAVCAIGMRGQPGLRGRMPWEGDERPEFRADDGDADRWFDPARLVAAAASAGNVSPPAALG